MVTNNRRDFIQLHRKGKDHVGIIVFTFNPDFVGIATGINSALADERAGGRFLARIDGAAYSLDD